MPGSAQKDITPAPALQDDSVLLIPEPEPGQTYPGRLQPGYYDRHQLVKLLRQHQEDPLAIRFIADMLETGNPVHDRFVEVLRKSLANPQALKDVIAAIA